MLANDDEFETNFIFFRYIDEMQMIFYFKDEESRICKNMSIHKKRGLNCILKPFEIILQSFFR